MTKIELSTRSLLGRGCGLELRDFHGYTTPRGGTYNAYLIVDEKIALVDTVKHVFNNEMIDRIKQIIDPARIDYVISNHVEMDPFRLTCPK